MKKEYHHETFWTRFLTAALVVYLLRVLLIAGEGKGEPEVSVGRFSVDAAFSETKWNSSALVSGGGPEIRNLKSR